MSQRFPPEVHQFIRENVTGRTAEELAAMTNTAFGTNFTPKTMKSYKQNHKLKSGTRCGLPKGHPPRQFPAPVAEFIRANYIGIGHAKMAAMLKENFGLDYKPSQIKGFYGNHHLHSGLTGRFQEGHIPPNKGKKGISHPNSEKTQFRKGHNPHNKMPIGAITTKADGYLWKKIGEGSQEWKQLHLLLWEEANGPVPDGCLVSFKDCNKQNCVLDNLMLITKSEHSVMNKHGLRFSTPEHTETGLLIAKVKIAANPKNRRKHGNSENR